MKLRRRTIIGVLLGLALLAVVVPLGIVQFRLNSATDASVDPGDYPPFVAEYVETTRGSNAAVTRTWRVDYDGKGAWRKEVLSVQGDQGRPEDEIGTVWTFRNGELSIKHANADKAITVPHPEGFVPFFWLQAGRISYLKNMGVAVQTTRAANNQQVVRWDVNRVTLDARGVPQEGRWLAPDDVEFKARSFRYK